MDAEITVNGSGNRVTARGDTPILYLLRNDIGLNGPQFGCGLGQCGACMVLLDDEAVSSCTLPVSRAVGRKITTLEGLGTADHPHPVQQAFLEEQAAQCGYCTNGMIISIAALLAARPNADEREIREALDANLCRCGTHLRILRAARRAAELTAGRAAEPAAGEGKNE
ncbi:MAG TPA: (2Fe-2S)-binding protein [Spirochaetia bacterium]|nr:(2Fe-2S)-binding protein [Spirochaetia bacterium]